MISAEFCRLMARYNAWQNANLIKAADTLTDAERRADRGAFFGSITATFNHLYWADALMLARLQGDPRPERRIAHSLIDPAKWDTFKTLRTQRDAEIAAWAMVLSDEDSQGSTIWFPGDGSQRMECPRAVCTASLFQHQIHHRGQVHAMLTAAGATPGVTDLILMP